MKKPLKIAGLCLLGLILIAVLLPLIFKKQIITLVKKELNASLTAVVDFHDVNISFFRRFPRVSIRLENVSVVGTNEFAKDTLLSASSLDASVDLISFFKEEKKVHRLDLQSPRIHALVTKEGKANWDIARPDSNAKNDTNASDASFRLKLSKYSISNGYIYYNDEPSGMKAEISGLNHEGSGDLTDDIFTLSTNTESASAYFAYEGIPYLNGVKASIQSDIVIDNRTSTYTFNHTKLSVNNLDVEADGFFQMASDSSYNMDIQFNAPSTDFKDLLSLIPAVYRNGFDELKAGGTAAFNGFVKGTYSPVAMPSYELNATVDKGFFQYPNLPKPVKNIQLRLKAANPDGIDDHHLNGFLGVHTPLLNREFPGNPVADWNYVFIPYCTGDVHTGRAVTVYSDPQGIEPDLEYHHNGHDNVMAAIDWMAGQFPAIPRMLVTGCSAGGAGATANYYFVRSGLDIERSYLLADSGPIFPNSTFSAPLHEKINDSWHVDEVLEEQPEFAALMEDFGNINTVLAEQFPDDRLAVAFFRRDFNYSRYSYERFYEPTPTKDEIHAMWWDDTQKLMTQFDTRDNLSYYIPDWRAFNASHCTMIGLTWDGTEIQEAGVDLGDYIDHVLDDDAPLQDWLESEQPEDQG